MNEDYQVCRTLRSSARWLFRARKMQGKSRKSSPVAAARINKVRKRIIMIDDEDEDLSLKRGSQGHGHVHDLRRALSTYVRLSYLTIFPLPPKNVPRVVPISPMQKFKFAVINKN